MNPNIYFFTTVFVDKQREAIFVLFGRDPRKNI